MALEKEINKLVEAGVIDDAAATRIRDYYAHRTDSSAQRQLVVFGILGALLVGLGIILIIAHNWDQFSKLVRTILAFLPLVISQVIAFYVLSTEKFKSTAWRESSSVLLFFSTAASISLISQIYNIPGNLEGFLFTWMLLSLPLIYLMKSSMVSLLYLIGITVYGYYSGYTYPEREIYYYWIFLAAYLPFYFVKINKHSNFNTFRHWMTPLSMTIILGTLSDSFGDLMWLDYLLLFGLFQVFGQWLHVKKGSILLNGYRIIGSLGTIFILMVFTFREFWQGVSAVGLNDAMFAPEVIAGIILLFGMLYFIYYLKKQPTGPGLPFWIYLLMIPVFIIGYVWPWVVILVNLTVLVIGILKIREGARRDNLLLINFGLLIIAFLITCRFFDTDLSFVVRGILFLVVGAGFFAANYLMLKRRKHA